MNIVANMTTRKNNEKSKHKHYLRPKLVVYNNKKNKKINFHQIKTKTKQFNLYFIRKDMAPIPYATGYLHDNKVKLVRSSEKLSFLNTINFRVINVISYQLNKKMFIYIYMGSN